MPAGIKRDKRPKARAVVEAARHADLELLERLRRDGADLDAPYCNYRPLDALMQRGEPAPARLRCLEWLLAHGADPELPGGWPLARAIVIAGFTGQPEYVEVLRRAVAMDGFAAAALGDVAGVKRALRRDAGFARARDLGGLTALHCAAGSRMPGREEAAAEIAGLLIDAGADPRARVQASGHELDATYFAAGAGRSAVYVEILERGGDPTEALSHAVRANRFDLAEIALRHGGKPDRATANNRPLLNDLIRWGRMDGTKWLLAHGASANVPDRAGWTAVHQAASRGNARMLQAALRAGGDPARKDKRGHTPLDVARIMRREKLLALLA
jgi:hypothetical protein